MLTDSDGHHFIRDTILRLPQPPSRPLSLYELILRAEALRGIWSCSRSDPSLVYMYPSTSPLSLSRVSSSLAVSSIVSFNATTTIAARKQRLPYVVTLSIRCLNSLHSLSMGSREKIGDFFFVTLLAQGFSVFTAFAWVNRRRILGFSREKRSCSCGVKSFYEYLYEFMLLLCQHCTARPGLTKNPDWVVLAFCNDSNTFQRLSPTATV